MIEMQISQYSSATGMLFRIEVQNSQIVVRNVNVVNRLYFDPERYGKFNLILCIFCLDPQEIYTY